MKINEKGIIFENEFNIFKRFFSYKRYKLSVDKIEVDWSHSFLQLNDGQLKRLDKFIDKYNGILPYEILKEYKYFKEILKKRC